MVRILFDITRLLKRDARAQPTGIDRVALAYGRWLSARDDIELAPMANVGGRRVAVRRAVLDHLLQVACAVSNRPAATTSTFLLLQQALSCGHPGAGSPLRASAQRDSIPILARSRTALRALRARVTAPPRGDIYLNVTHGGLEHATLLGNLAREGTRAVVMVHDLIPITHPEFCADGASERHWRRIESVLESGAEILVNSRTTAETVQAYALATGRASTRTHVARLGIESVFRRAVQPLKAAGQPYFVAVGTIEPRKNLGFLLRIWTELNAQLGELAPRLVLVGRRGWETRAVLEALDRSPAARRLVLEAGDLPDPALATLVGGACALLAPSLVEGFDLPALEALTLRTPVIASDIPAHRELALGAKLMAPGDTRGWLSAILAACKAREPAPPFAPPSWRAHFDVVSEVLGVGRRWDAAGGE